MRCLSLIVGGLGHLCMWVCAYLAAVNSHRPRHMSGPFTPPPCRSEAFPLLPISLPFPFALPLEVEPLNLKLPQRCTWPQTHLSAILSLENASGGNRTALSVYLLSQSFTRRQYLVSEPLPL